MNYACKSSLPSSPHPLNDSYAGIILGVTFYHTMNKKCDLDNEQARPKVFVLAKATQVSQR